MESKEFKKKVLPLGQKLYRYASGILKDPYEAEDVIQDIFLKLWNMREKIKEIENLNAFAFRITRNLCLDKIKAKRLRFYDEPSIIGIREPEANDPDPESMFEIKDTINSIKHIINGLPEQQQTIIHLRDVEGYSYEEISQITNMEVNNIRVALSRARRSVRESLAKMNQLWKI